MGRLLLNMVLAAAACAGVVLAATVEDDFTSSQPHAVARNELPEPTCCDHHHHLAHSTAALPPPLTIAYQDPCHPCCTNCLTYSDFHIDNDGDECCKPAAVIKTHHFVKKINYKCCTGPYGDVQCEPYCTKIVCNPCGNKGSIAVWPGGSRYCRECCCEPCACHHHENHSSRGHHEPCGGCGHHEPCGGCGHREECG
ncbi:hypothetical protein GGF46_002523 [Coemansia sp. RSA 552]|nr:hypothetical protein GGF46_002523 [Coemansia sp. RSA 552]